MRNDIKVCLKEYGVMSDKSLDWYFLSCKETDKWKKLMARVKYHQYKEERAKLARRLNDLCQNLTI